MNNKTPLPLSSLGKRELEDFRSYILGCNFSLHRKGFKVYNPAMIEILLSNPNTNIIVSLFGAFLGAVSLLLTLQTRSKIAKAFDGNARDVVERLIVIKSSLEEREMFEKEMKEFLEILTKRVSMSVKSPSIIRFEPFQGVSSGGNQSFSTALIDEKGNGLVLSGLYYSRDRVSLFAKPVEKYASTFELTPEEKEVISEMKKK